jgi:uncharacterized protein (DUF983 family)
VTRPEDLEDDDRVPVVAFVPFICPNCGQPKPFTRGVRGRTRWHKCKKCGLTYKSREMTAAEVAAFLGKG